MPARIAVCTNRDYCSLGDRRLVLHLREDEAFFCPECGRVLQPTTPGAERIAAARRGLAVAALAATAAAALIALRHPHATPSFPPPHAAVAAIAPPRPRAVVRPKPPALPIPMPKPAPANSAAAATPKPPAPARPDRLVLTVAATPELAASLLPKLLIGFLAAEGMQARLDVHTPPIVTIRFGPDTDRQVITVSPEPSAVALAALATGAADMAWPGRPLTGAERASLSGATICDYASAGTVVVVHPARTLPGLARRQLAAILDGRLTNWSRLKQSAAPLHAYVPLDLATTGAMGYGIGAAHLPFGHTLTTLPEDAAVLRAVAADPDGMGFVTDAPASGVRPVALEAAAQAALKHTLAAYAPAAPKPFAAGLLAYLKTTDAIRIEIGAGFAPPPPAPVAAPAAPLPKPAPAKPPVAKPPAAKSPAAKHAKPATAPALPTMPAPPKPSARAASVAKPVQLLLKLAPSVLPRPDSSMLAATPVQPPAPLPPLAQKAATSPAPRASAITTGSPGVSPQTPEASSQKPALPIVPAEQAAQPAAIATQSAAEPAPAASPKPAPATGPAATQTQAAADAPHRRIFQLPEGAKITFGPLKDVRMPTMVSRQRVLPAHPESVKPTQGQIQVDCAIDASGVPQDCKLLSASHSGGVSASILSWLTSGAIRYAPTDANGHAGGRRVLTVKFPGQ
jgi:hypothetical protein